MSERFSVTYRLRAPDASGANALAEAIALEDTLEIPRDVVPKGYIEDVVLGRVENVDAVADAVWHARVGYHIDAVGAELPQLLNVVLGNASILEGVKAIGLTPNQDLLDRFPGAAFGSAGVRARTGRTSGGLLCAVIKPQGSDSQTLADLCFEAARAGVDIVKEDHGLSNQDAAPFRSRVTLCAKAVARANAARSETGDVSRALYFANIGGHGDEVRDLALYAKDAGADGILIIPGLLGFDAMNRLRQHDGFDLPIMAHPSHLGPYVLSPDHGYSHGMLFGTLMRLSGADISVFPNHGGRFGFSSAQCDEIAAACRDPNGPGPEILPSPGGGMSPERLPELEIQYGQDCVFLIGGGILRFGDQIGAGIAQMRRALDHRR